MWDSVWTWLLYGLGLYFVIELNRSLERIANSLEKLVKQGRDL